MATATKSNVDEKQMLIGGSWQGSSDGKTFESLDPATGEPHATVPEATAKDVDAAVDAARAAFESEEWRGLPAAARAKLHLASRRADRREHGRAGRARDPRPGQADRRLEDLYPRRGRALPLLRRLGHEDRGRDPTGLDPGRIPLHAARADRRLRADHPVELPDEHRELEDRPRARLRQHRRGEARGGGLAHHAPAGRADPGGGDPGRSAQRRHRRPGGRASARQPRSRRQDLLHRLDRGRARDRPGVGRQPEAGQPRAGRQGADRDPRRRRHRRGRRGQPAGRVPQRRAGLRRLRALLRRREAR